MPALFWEHCTKLAILESGDNEKVLIASVFCREVDNFFNICPDIWGLFLWKWDVSDAQHVIGSLKACSIWWGHWGYPVCAGVAGVAQCVLGSLGSHILCQGCCGLASCAGIVQHVMHETHDRRVPKMGTGEFKTHHETRKLGVLDTMKFASSLYYWIAAWRCEEGYHMYHHMWFFVIDFLIRVNGWQ